MARQACRQVPSSARNEEVKMLKLFLYHSLLSISIAIDKCE